MCAKGDQLNLNMQKLPVTGQMHQTSTRSDGFNKYLDVRRTPCEHVVVLDELAELREVPAVPLADSHSECVQVFVELIQQADALDDHVVRPCRVHLHLLDSNKGNRRWQ